MFETHPVFVDGAILSRHFDDVMELIKKDGLFLQYVHLSSNNFDINIEAVRQNGLALQFVKNRHRHNFDINMEAVRQNGLALQFVKGELRYDIDLNLRALECGEEKVVEFVLVKKNKKIDDFIMRKYTGLTLKFILENTNARGAIYTFLLCHKRLTKNLPMGDICLNKIIRNISKKFYD